MRWLENLRCCYLTQQILKTLGKHLHQAENKPNEYIFKMLSNQLLRDVVKIIKERVSKSTQFLQFPAFATSNICVLTEYFTMLMDLIYIHADTRAVINFRFTCSLDPHICNKLVTLWVNYINLQASSLITSRAYQTYSAITSVTGYSPH